MSEVEKEPFMLHGLHIFLRPATTKDIDDYLRLLNDPEGARLTGTQQAFTKKDTIKWLEKISQTHTDRVDLMIIEKETGSLVGEVVLNEIDSDNRSANIRIAMNLSLPVLGKGYGSDALRLMIQYGFEKLKLHRISLSVFIFNERAIHVYEKLGFHREGVLRDVLFDGELYHSEIVMGLLESEWQTHD
jgi:RimJ/RimL family protein N-acetyltransferase